MRRRRRLIILSEDEIERMRAAGRLAADLLCHLGEMVEPGITTQDLDDEAMAYAEKHEVEHAPLGYKGFPRAICTSVNDVVCHGIPEEGRTLEEGDIVAIDVTPVLDGFHGDNCATFPVGEVSETAQKLIQVTADCLMRGIGEIRAGKRLGDIGAAIQEHAESNGFSVVRDFIGHGIGRTFHGAPEVPHFGNRNSGLRLRRGMAFTVEPMINVGDYPTKVLDDDWTAVTTDGSLSAQFEHTIVVTQEGVEVMTMREGLDPFEVAPGCQTKITTDD
ncbi:MAG: type I methionyl aminopeptidase [Myxococcota bacterium]